MNENNINLETSDFTKVTRFLRSTGVLISLSAAATFLVQSFNQPNSIYRYYCFLSYLLVLGAAGLFSGLRLKDTSGARTFLTLAAAFIPIVFAQVGGFIYSHFGAAPRFLPRGFIYTASTLETATSLIALCVVAIPIAITSFSVLVKERAKRLLLLYGLTNAVLLIPERNPLLVSLLALFLCLSLVFQDFSHFSGEKLSRYFEARIARGLPLIPVAILLGRASMYDFSHYISGVVVAVLGLAMMLYSADEKIEYSKMTAAKTIGLAFSVTGWFTYMTAITTSISAELPQLGLTEYDLLTICLPYSFLLGLFSYRDQNTGLIYRRIAAVMAIGALTCQLGITGGLPISVLLIIVSTGVLCWSIGATEKGPLLAGCIGLVWGLLYQLSYAQQFFNLSPWISLAVLSVTAIFTASFLERNYYRIKAAGSEFRTAIEEWK